MEIPKVVKQYLGNKVYMFLTLVGLGVSITVSAVIFVPQYVMTQAQFEQFKKDDQITKAVFELQMVDLKWSQLKADQYQLKKLKKNKMADEDDIDRLDEIKDELKTLEAKRDSLQDFIKHNK